MKQYLFWLKTEYKRAAVMLPGIILKAIIPLVIIGMIAFCVSKWSGNEANATARIGVVAPRDKLTVLALGFVEDMKAIESGFALQQMEKEEALDGVASGSLQAAVVLPEDLLDNILVGDMVEISLFLPGGRSAQSLIFAEILKAGVKVLQTAQGEIYATARMGENFSLDYYVLQDLYQEINMFNLNLYLNREELFRIRSLSETENEGGMAYYAGALFTLYLLLSGWYLGGYIKRRDEEQEELEKRLGISVMAQLLGRILVTFSLLFVPVCLYLGMMAFLTEVALLSGLPGLLVSMLVVAAGMQFLYLCVENKRVAILPVFLSTAILGYCSGCIVPQALLPEAVQIVGYYLPTDFMRSLLTILFTGIPELLDNAFQILFCIIDVLLFIGAYLLCYRVRRKGKRQKNVGEWCPSTIFGILWKRTLRSKTIWVCLIVCILASIGTATMEKNSKTIIPVAIYTEDEAFIERFRDYEGLVEFIIVDEEEQVEKLVQKKQVQAGYILDEDCREEILFGDATWSITVYESADATMTFLLNEIVFERIFYDLSIEWYRDFILKQDVFISAVEKLGKKQFAETLDDVLDQKMLSDKTVLLHVLYADELGEGMDGAGFSTVVPEKKEQSGGYTFYPTHLVMILCVLGCMAVGVVQALWDKKEGRDFFHAPGKVLFYTILDPVLLGVATVILLALLL